MMESTNLDMGELFDDDGNDDDDIGAMGTMADLEDTQPQDTEDQENAEVLARLKDLSKGASKKVVRKPQPKLDPTRLTSERGIPVLPKLFENTKFKGKGHEAQDLAVIMRKMEHWAHRLFPMMPFDDVIERVEKLGGKKEVQTCIKKIRMDMPILNDDFVGSEPEDDVVRNDVDMEEQPPSPVKNAEDVWDELLREEAEVTQTKTSSQTLPTSQTQPVSSQDPDILIATPLPKSTSETDNSNSNNTSGGMTPAQIERMERNKQLALERRLKKLGRHTPAGKSLFASQQSQKIAQNQNSPMKTNDTQVEDLNSKKTNKQEPTLTQDNKSTVSDNSTQPNTNTETSQPPVADGTNAADNATDPDNSTNTVNTDNDMSEVIEQGPNQVNVVDKNAKNAQNWNTENAAASLDNASKSVDNLDSTEAMEVDNDIGQNNSGEGSQHNSEVTSASSNNSTKISEVIEKQDLDKPSADKLDTAGSNDVIDSEEMSEVIPNQTGLNQDKANSANECDNDTQVMSEVIENQANS